MRKRRTISTALLTAPGLLTLATLASATASAWAPARTAPIHPGVQTETRGAQCTSNFIFKRGTTTYIGQAAHCSGTGAANETNGCDARSLPIGTRVKVDGARKPGVMAYNSWISMQRAGERGEEACAYNDFALVRLAASDVKRINPSVPTFGGPRGSGAATATQPVYTYGNSSIRGGVTELSPKRGRVVSRSPGGWSYDVYTATPGIPGDSGSAFLNQRGQALGVLSTVAIAPLPASNGVGSIVKELAYARSHGMSRLRLIDGTERFAP